MAFENIEIEHGNFTVNRLGSTFFTMDHTTNTLIEKQSDATVVFNYTMDTNIIEVQSLQFDGVFYWSLERQGTAGFRVRKWEIDPANTVILLDEFSFATDVINKYDVNSMAVESYADSLDNQETPGTTIFDLNDGSVVQIGDEIVIGPSTAGGFEGEFFTATVIDKLTDQTVEISPALTKTFNPNDTVFFTRSFYIFSDTGPGGVPGALYRFRFNDAFPLSVDVSNIYAGVTASTFFQEKLLFVKGGEIIYITPDSGNIFRSQAIDNLDETRGEYLTSFDLTAFSTTIYRLEQEKVFFDAGQWNTEDWSPLFNYSTSPTVAEVYFVAVKAEPPLLHTFKSGIPTADLQSDITVTVLDQFRSPVSGRVVDLSSTGGGLSSVQETTNANGQVKVVYTADNTVGNVTITADVS